MFVKKCKWKDGKQAPVFLMIDDFANKCMLKKKNGNYIGSDWGARGYQKNSFLDILDKKLLKKFPYIKVTLFLVTGRRESIINNGIKSYSAAANENTEFENLLKQLSSNKSFEIAYHGLTHGKIVDEKFQQEWQTFRNLEEAKDTIRIGKSIYEDITGEKFRGGKYCGYVSNDFSDQSIAETGFTWWCRHWDGGLFINSEKDALSFEMSLFDGVVDMPSTLNGAVFSLRCIKGLLNKGYLRGIYYKLVKHVSMEKMINYLVENQYVISIQEHSSPMREDDKIQTPNIISDMPNLIYLFNYLKKFDLWYANASEVADYFNLYQSVQLDYEEDCLKVFCEEKFDNQWISVEISDIECSEIELWNTAEKISMEKRGNCFVANVKALYKGNLYHIRRKSF